MKHTVNEAEIKAWLDEETWSLAASCAGASSCKRLETSNKGAFRVTDHDHTCYFDSLAAAVAAYNNAP